MAERSYPKSNIKLVGFLSQLQASYVSSHTEDLRYNETACVWMTVYVYIVLRVIFIRKSVILILLSFDNGLRFEMYVDFLDCFISLQNFVA